MVLFSGSKSSQSARILDGGMSNNPILGLYQIKEQIGTGGVGKLWKIYNAVRNDTKQEASIFFFDKSVSVKVPSKCQRAGRSTITDLMRYDAKQLQHIRHSRILKLLETHKENEESIAFATEPILGSLSDILSSGQHESSGDHTPSEGQPFRLEEMEIKCGILQIAEALAFLHSGAGWLHYSVCPDNVYITKWGSWKVAGFFFAEKLQNGLNRAPNIRWTALKASKYDQRVQPDLNYLAPECLVETECTTAADIFSLAVTICTIYQGNSTPLIDTNQNLESYTKQLLELDKKVALIRPDLGPNLTEAVSKMLSVDVKQRPSAQLFLLIKFFNDQGMLCLRLLEDVQYADTVQKVQFYCSQLKESLCLIPEKLWYSRILPRLIYELDTSPDLASAIVKPLLYMLQHCSNDRVHYLRPVFQRLVRGAKLEHPQMVSSLFDNIHLIMTRVQDVQAHLLHLVFICMKSVGNIQTQEAAVTCLPKMKEFLTKEYVDTKIFPLLGEIFTNSPSQLQAHALDSLSQLFSLTTEKSMVEFINTVGSVQLEDPQVIVTLAKFYEALVRDWEDIPADYISTLVLPKLCPLMANTKLNQQQLTVLIRSSQTLLAYVADKKLGSNGWNSFSPSNRSDSFLQVPASRPQRHSIGGGVLPRVTVTTPSTALDRTRKFSTSTGDNLLSAPRSHPTSPHIRRHSVNVPTRPNSFTNLSHNIACMLSWKKKA